MKRPAKLNQASAYFRLAAKADRAGQFRQATTYRDRAERLVNENRRDAERLDAMKAERDGRAR